MKICWEILDALRLTKPEFSPKKHGKPAVHLISDWGIEINGKIEYIDCRWIYTEHCWYCGSDFLKPIKTKWHYCDSECKRLHVIWKRDWKRLKKQRWRLMRLPKYGFIEKPTVGMLGQPLGILRQGTPEHFEMRSTISKILVSDVAGKAQYNHWAHRLWYIEEHRKDPDNPKLLQIKCIMCSKWYTPLPRKMSKVTRWCDHGTLVGKDKKANPPSFYCSLQCEKQCRTTRTKKIREHKHKIKKISYSQYHKIPNSILYCDWQLELIKLHKKMRLELKRKKRAEKLKTKREEKEKRKKYFIERTKCRSNPLGIYMCNSCSRFMGKNMISKILVDNTIGLCKKCESVKGRLYYEQNSNKLKLYGKTWRQNNPDKIKIKRKKYGYRCKKKEAFDPTANKLDMGLIYKYSRMLTRKTGILHEVDHIIPTAKNGKHHEDNLQVLLWYKNNKKSDKLNTEIIGIRLPEIKEYYSNII